MPAPAPQPADTPDPAPRSAPSAYPFLTTFVHLLLPERHRQLQLVDRLAAGSQRVGAVRRGNGDDHARLADVHAPDAVVDCYIGQVVAPLELGRELLHDLLGHALVRLVLEVEDVAVARAPARGPDEGRYRSRLVAANLVDGGTNRKRCVRELERPAGDG